MPKMSPAECFRALELDPSASPAEVRAAFRRLAKQNHPDLNRSPGKQNRFVQVVRAYQTLKHELNLHLNGSDVRTCPICGRYKELLEGLDGRPSCPDCLLGETRRKRHLPMPILTTVKHVSVLSLYVVGIVFMIRAMTTDSYAYGVISLVAVLAGLLILAVTCLRVKEIR